MFEKYNAIIDIKIQDDNQLRITRVQKYNTNSSSNSSRSG